MTKKPAKNKSQPPELQARNMPSSGKAPVLCIVDRPGGAIQLWGMTLRERLITQFAREGVTEVISSEQASEWLGSVIYVRADCVIDPPLIPVLVSEGGFLLLSDDAASSEPIAAHFGSPHDAGNICAALANDELLDTDIADQGRRPGELKAVFWDKLRKREVPYARLVEESNCAEIEWRMFMGTYKGATDLITKYLWPRPAFYVTRWLAPTFVTPNQVTALSAVCVVLAFWLFLEGYYVWGLVSAWMMTFLDTVDGKLARTTLTSSKWGDVFDHGIDLVHPPFWYVAWALGLAIVGYAWTPKVLAIVLGAIIGGYILQRIMEGISIALLKLEIHIWRPIDTFFRLITARRNPNLLILTVVTVFTGRPDLALELVAWWTVICLVLHGIQLVHALAVRARHGKLTSWMAKPAAVAES